MMSNATMAEQQPIDPYEPERRIVNFEDEQLEVCETHNLWGNLAVCLAKSEDDALYQALALDGKNVYYERFLAQGTDMATYTKKLLTQYNRLNKALQSKPEDEEAQFKMYNWQQNHLANNELIVQMDHVYGIMRPWLVADGRRPIEITI